MIEEAKKRILEALSDAFVNIISSDPITPDVVEEYLNGVEDVIKEEFKKLEVVVVDELEGN